MIGGVEGCLGCFLCQKWLRLSLTVDEYKPLDVGQSGGVSGQPRRVAAAAHLHSSGIFSMHAAW
jgi:hypothetical protein